ncbi:MAG: hypothetical protein ACRDTF_08970 [Pseudonocardiaceae bacterium]
MSPPRREDPQAPLLSIRTTLVLLLALLSGAGVVALTVLANRHPAEAALAGLAATAAGVKFFHDLIA